MKISIVTISFNQAKYLKECIDSVLSQEKVDLEYIVVDPGSSDGSREIIQSFGSKISRVVFEPDNGPSHGLNRGFSHATGDIYCYLNADDYLLPGALSFVKEFFQKHAECDVLYGDGLKINGAGKVTSKILSSPWGLCSYLYGGCPVVQQSTFFRKGAFDAAGGFNEQNSTCWDGELLVDMARTGARFNNVENTLGVFRIHADSISGSGRSIDQYLRDRVRINQKILKADKSRFIHLCWQAYYKILRVFKRPAVIREKLYSMQNDRQVNQK